MLDANLARINVEGNRPVASLVVLGTFWSELRQQIAKRCDLEVVRLSQLINGVIYCVLQLRRFCKALVARTIVANDHLGDTRSSQLVCELEYFLFKFLIVLHEISFSPGSASLPGIDKR